MKHLGDAIQELVTTLLSRTSAVQSETSEYFRVDQATISNESVLRQIVSINKELLAAGLGSVSLFGEVAGEFDLNAVSFAEIDQEILSIIFNKSAVEQSVCAIFNFRDVSYAVGRPARERGAGSGRLAQPSKTSARSYAPKNTFCDRSVVAGSTPRALLRTICRLAAHRSRATFFLSPI